MKMRFRLNYFIIFISVMLVLAANSIAQDEIENLLTNPDFENGTNGWTLGGGNSLAIDDKEECPTGTNVVMATIDVVGAEAWEPEMHSPSFALENGRTYTYSYWAKTEPGETRAIYSSFESNSPVWAGGGGINITLTDEWLEYHATAPWVAEDRPTVFIHIAYNYPPTEMLDVWFAHFRVYEGEYVEEELDEGPKIAVTPAHRLTTTWGKIKSR